MIRFITILLTLLLLLGLTAPAVGTDTDPFAWEWYEIDAEQNLRINLFVFTRSTCSKCPKAVAFVARLRQKYPWLHARQYEISQHAGNLELYRRMAASLHRPAGQVPALFYCRQLTVGYTSDQQTGRQIEANLLRCYHHLRSQLQDAEPASPTPPPSPQDSADARWRSVGEFACASVRPEVYLFAASLPAVIEGEQQPVARAAEQQGATAAERLAGNDETGPVPAYESPSSRPQLELPVLPPVEEEKVELPLVGRVDAREMSLPAFTVIIAGCDAFNPCAFFVLLSLLGMLIHARSRLRMVLVGGIFVLFSGLFYFLFMAAWLNLFFLAGHLPLITIVAGTLAIVVALINIKDYFLFHRGVSLSIPDAAKPRLFERMRGLVAATQLTPLLLGTTALAITANSYELLCTAGFPMVFTRVLTLRELPAMSYYAYLVLYNLVYIIPLATIVLAFTVTLGRRKLSEKEGRILKLLSGVMMLTLGVILLAAPQLLQYVLTAVVLLAVAVGLTTLIVLLDRACGRAARHRTSPGGPTRFSGSPQRPRKRTSSVPSRAS